MEIKSRLLRLLRCLWIISQLHFIRIMKSIGGISLIPLKDSLLNQTSIIWPLFLSVIGLWVEDQEWKDVKKIGCILILCLLAFPSDWSCFPVLCTNHIYKNQGNLKKQVLGMALYISMYVFVYCLCIDVVYGLLKFGIVLVYTIMSLYY